nr:uncharacterized protein LOC124809482 [Hydra vulgaris]
MFKQVGYKDNKTGIQSLSENLFSRKKLLCEIQHFFLQDANNSTLVLYGMSGVGKTHLARKYCEISYNLYKNFVWIDAAFGMLQTSIRNQCQILGYEVHDSKGEYFNIKVIVEKIHNYYKNEKTLYIFDNVDDESVKNLSMYISKKPKSFTLITSQWRTWSNNVNKMLVDIFSLKEAFTYVKKNIKENSDENIKNLIKELGYHPFAITQAIKYINIHKISIEKYIDRYRSKPSEILDNNNFPTEEESKSAIKAINLVLIKLEKTKPFPFKILNCLSHCDGQNISKQFITKISNQMETNDESLIDEAIGLLMSYSLLNCFDDKKYTIHELTQLTCQCFQKRNSSTNAYLDLIENCFKVELNEVKDHIDYGNHFVFQFIYMFHTNGKKLSETFHHMTTSIQRLLVCKGLFEEAIEILKAVQKFNTETYGENNIITLDTKDNIASCLNKMGKYNEALEILYSVDKIQTEILGINHPDTMTTKHNIALCLDNMGKYNEKQNFEFEESDSDSENSSDETYFICDELDQSEEIQDKPIIPIPSKTAQIMELYKDKLKWTNYVPTYSDIIYNDYPPIDSFFVKKHNKNRKFSSKEPFNVEINFTENGKPSTIHFVEKLSTSTMALGAVGIGFLTTIVGSPIAIGCEIAALKLEKFQTMIEQIRTKSKNDIDKQTKESIFNKGIEKGKSEVIEVLNMRFNKNQITIEGDDITIKGKKYTGTPGLWEIIVKSHPVRYTNDNRNKYKEILDQTDAIRSHLNSAKPRSSRSYKYTHTIKPIWEEMIGISGKGVIIEQIILPSDPNALFDMLKLRLAALQAGKTGARNEAVAICEELLRQGQIDDDEKKALQNAINLK